MIKDYTNTQVDPRQEQISEAFVKIIRDIDKRLDWIERMIVDWPYFKKELAIFREQLEKLKRPGKE